MTVVVRIWCGERERGASQRLPGLSVLLNHSDKCSRSETGRSETGRSARADLSEIAQQDSTDLSLGYWFRKVVAGAGRLQKHLIVFKVPVV